MGRLLVLSVLGIALLVVFDSDDSESTAPASPTPVARSALRTPVARTRRATVHPTPVVPVYSNAAPSYSESVYTGLYTGGGDRDCADFASSADANAYARTNPGANLDGDGDGYACEWGVGGGSTDRSYEDDYYDYLADKAYEDSFDDYDAYEDYDPYEDDYWDYMP